MREVAAKEKKAEDEAESKRVGRPGKGQKKNYVSFCGKCFWEYGVETATCLRCESATVPQAQRYAKLLVKVEEYKDRKSQRKDRKKKWENW